MFRWLLATFIVIPLVELYFLIEVGQILGAPNTILLVVLTALLGAGIARTQGLQLFTAIRDDLNRGVLPPERLLEAFLVLAGGLLLLTPGFVTDLTGFLLLIPATRRIFSRSLRKRFYNLLVHRRYER